MFRQPPPGPQPTWKRPIYLACSTLLGVITSYGLHSIIESMYLRQADPASITWQTPFGLGACALPNWLNLGLLGLGLVGGFLTGRVWWRLVYIEGRWGFIKKSNIKSTT